MYSDIAPDEGRSVMAGYQNQNPPQQMTWMLDFSLAGEFHWGKALKRGIKLSGRIEHWGLINPELGWADLELSGREPVIEDLILVGSRPLPQDNIVCLCRHPLDKAYFIAATADSCLLLLDAAPHANLAILKRAKMGAAYSSLVCCGRRLLGLEKPAGRQLHLFDVSLPATGQPAFIPLGKIAINQPLEALAEYDFQTVWGLGADGTVLHIKVAEADKEALVYPEERIAVSGSLHRRKFAAFKLTDRLRSMYRYIKAKKIPRLTTGLGDGGFTGFAFDGDNFWTFRRTGTLLLYNRELSLVRSFASRPEVSMSNLSYTHNYLLIVDREHQQLHHCYPADSLEPAAALNSWRSTHPGYLPAGTAASGKIHDLCLLYTGGEGSSRIHQYNQEKLLPLVGFRSVKGEIKDYFMDGFLLLAQYSPLLNGRSFAPDLNGPPSRREDWAALFDEYFHPLANLSALEDCARVIEHHLGRKQPLRVVLGIPTPDPRCLDWDSKGCSLALESNRIQVVRWAFDELLRRWEKAGFRRLILAGFYYLAEQGVFNDPVIALFPQLCRDKQFCSFAIPGLSSSYMTEFTRAGFDCVSLQSSHSFWKPMGRPRLYLLKCAGHIARDFGMGMEVELPFNVTDPEGAARFRDYLKAARIQGWAGAFKAYFQSYNLIKSLADSKIPECRRLYDELYYMSRISRQPRKDYHRSSRHCVPVDWEGEWTGNGEKEYFRISIEGNQGIIRLNELSTKP